MSDIDVKLKAALGILLLLGGMAFYRALHPATTFAADGIDPAWDSAAHAAQHASQPRILLFTADWCPACQRLHTEVLSRSDIQQELQNHYFFYTVDLTNPSPEVETHARKFRVQYIPLLIRYDANGKEADRTNYLGPDELITWLKAGE